MKNKKIKIPKKINIFDLYTSLEFQEIIRSKKKKKKINIGLLQGNFNKLEQVIL